MTTKVALITGANKGIGYETARQLGEQGFTVLVGARDAGRGEEAAARLREGGADAHLIEIDVTDDASVQAAAEAIAREHDHLDVLVNNAGVPGIGSRRAAPSETSLEDMQAVYEINVFGVVRVTNAMLPLLRKAPAARIVNVSSEIGSLDAQTNPESPFSALPATVQYPSSKAAVDMITVQYARELRDTPIKVNAANPGHTRTDFTGGRGQHDADQGAYPSVHLATLPDDGPSGILWGALARTGGYGVLAW